MRARLAVDARPHRTCSAARSPARPGTRSPFFAPYEAYRTADGYLVVVGTGGRDAWGTLCRTLGLERLIDDPRFADERRPRAERRGAPRRARGGARGPPGRRTGLRRSTAGGVACAPVQRLPEVLESEQVAALRMVASQRHPAAGDVPTVRLPVRLSDAESTAATSTPLLGDANETGWGSSRPSDRLGRSRPA